jgi:hypothetical protein
LAITRVNGPFRFSNGPIVYSVRQPNTPVKKSVASSRSATVMLRCSTPDVITAPY